MANSSQRDELQPEAHDTATAHPRPSTVVQPLYQSNPKEKTDPSPESTGKAKQRVVTKPDTDTDPEQEQEQDMDADLELNLDLELGVNKELELGLNSYALYGKAQAPKAGNGAGTETFHIAPKEVGDLPASSTSALRPGKDSKAVVPNSDSTTTVSGTKEGNEKTMTAQRERSKTKKTQRRIQETPYRQCECTMF